MTFFLSLTKNDDGSIGGFLRNPEANFGRHFHIEKVVRDGNRINFIEPSVETVRLAGELYPDYDAFSIFIPDAGGTFDFVRVSDDQQCWLLVGWLGADRQQEDIPVAKSFAERRNATHIGVVQLVDLRSERRIVRVAFERRVGRGGRGSEAGRSW